jgi:hypothetical protein
VVGWWDGWVSSLSLVQDGIFECLWLTWRIRWMQIWGAEGSETAGLGRLTREGMIFFGALGIRDRRTVSGVFFRFLFLPFFSFFFILALVGWGARFSRWLWMGQQNGLHLGCKTGIDLVWRLFCSLFGGFSFVFLCSGFRLHFLLFFQLYSFRFYIYPMLYR